MLVKMGKKNALKTEGIYLTLPIDWMPKLDALRKTYGAISKQDVIRAILAGLLEKEDSG